MQISFKANIVKENTYLQGEHKHHKNIPIYHHRYVIQVIGQLLHNLSQHNHLNKWEHTVCTPHKCKHWFHFTCSISPLLRSLSQACFSSNKTTAGKMLGFQAVCGQNVLFNVYRSNVSQQSTFSSPLGPQIRLSVNSQVSWELQENSP